MPVQRSCDAVSDPRYRKRNFHAYYNRLGRCDGGLPPQLASSHPLDHLDPAGLSYLMSSSVESQPFSAVDLPYYCGADHVFRFARRESLASRLLPLTENAGIAWTDPHGRRLSWFIFLLHYKLRASVSIATSFRSFWS